MSEASVDKVYIVTAGEYSSYGIERVFLDRVLADEHAVLVNARDRHAYAQVEEWDVTDGPVRNLSGYMATVLLDGTERDVQPAKFEVVGNRRSHVLRTPRPEPVASWVYGYGTTKELALKVARDEVAKWKAEEAGL